MLRKILTVAALLSLSFVPAPSAQAEDFTIAEFLQGITDPHVVAGVSYNKDTEEFAAVLTANIVGFKAGTLPLYIGGVGVSLNTVAPGLENAPFASISLPFLTAAPWGEQVVLQVGMSTPIGGGLDVGNSYYFGVGLSLSGGPNELSSKRVKRAQAKAAAKKRADATQGPPVPIS